MTVFNAFRIISAQVGLVFTLQTLLLVKCVDNLAYWLILI